MAPISKTIAVLAGDGIGPEIMTEAVKILKKVSSLYSHSFNFKSAAIGGAAFEQFGNHFPKETQEICAKSDAVLFGSVGGPMEATSNTSHKDYAKFYNAEKNSLLGLRKQFDFAVNVRPVKVYPMLASLCPLKGVENAKTPIEMVIVRELVGDVYFGKHETAADGNSAVDYMEYTKDQILKPLHFAFKTALSTKTKRPPKVTLVDKANVLDTSRLWRKTALELKESFKNGNNGNKEYEKIELEFMFVDNAAMQLILKPESFGVIVTGNLFGDILSDAASVLPGSLGLMPSASLNIPDPKTGVVKLGMFEPSGGSAPDIANRNIANPIGQILSAALMLKYSFGMTKEAEAIEEAVDKVLKAGIRTQDLIRKGSEETKGLKVVGTEGMGNEIVKALDKI